MAIAVIAAAMPQAPSFEPFRPQEKVSKGRAETSIRSDVAWVGPSQTFHIIVAIKPDAGWHVYWENPGASGAPTEIEIEASEGFTIGKPRFPRPDTFHGQEGNTFGYKEEAAIYVPVTAPDSLEDGELSFHVTTAWLACKENCVMGEETHEFKLKGVKAMRGPMHKDLQLKRWESMLPKPLSELKQGEAYITGNTMHISGVTVERSIEFIGIEQKEIRFGYQEQITRNGNQFRVPIPIYPDFVASKGEDIVIEGILLLGRKMTDPSFVVRVVVESTKEH